MQLSPISTGAAPSGQEELSFTSAYTDEAGVPGFRIWKTPGGNFLRVAYRDDTQFWLERNGIEVWSLWPGDLTLEDTATYLLGPILGLVLRLRGVTCLHASAVVLDGQAVAFVGNAGAGKSTTAAAFARRGNAILSDDVVALTERGGAFFVSPAYPYLSLWPEAVEVLYGSPEALPHLSRNYEKRCLSLEDQKLQFEERSLPLAAIYILGERRGDPAPTLEDVPAQRAFLTLVANSFATCVLDTALRAQEFALLGRLVSTVPVRELRAHCDANRLAKLCEQICINVHEMHLRD
jgi:hypothetical protein